MEQIDLADGGGGKCGGGKDGSSSNKESLAPSSVLVAFGLLSGVLEVISVLVDRDQTIQFVLEGSLKRKTELDRVMEKLGSHSFKEVVTALLNQYG
ncbi:MAG: hypothetical protein JL50_01740 [Peptococcaceae bacterium BICA1-7]|nr:MAG: hypothetical protein JL50_01740 [Peptococcaceae bacterium BICA1-7]